MDDRILISQIRSALGISQEELGRRLGGVSLQTVFRWEHGRSKPSGLYRKAIEKLMNDEGLKVKRGRVVKK